MEACPLFQLGVPLFLWAVPFFAWVRVPSRDNVRLHLSHPKPPPWPSFTDTSTRFVVAHKQRTATPYIPHTHTTATNSKHKTLETDIHKLFATLQLLLDNKKEALLQEITSLSTNHLSQNEKTKKQLLSNRAQLEAGNKRILDSLKFTSVDEYASKLLRSPRAATTSANADEEEEEDGKEKETILKDIPGFADELVKECDVSTVVIGPSVLDMMDIAVKHDLWTGIVKVKQTSILSLSLWCT